MATVHGTGVGRTQSQGKGIGTSIPSPIIHGTSASLAVSKGFGSLTAVTVFPPGTFNYAFSGSLFLVVNDSPTN